ncbi:MAG: PQQ-dependent sugar dehydrogenase [Planctomycetota bacterium]
MRTPPRLATYLLLLVAAALAACGGGGGGGGGGGAPTSLSYAADPALYRVGVPATANAPSVGGGTPTAWVVAPGLPAGLALNPSTGVVSGTPLATAATADYLVTASNASGQVQTTLTLQVAAALPATMVSLEPGFEATVVASGLNSPVRMAEAPDGRLFFNELSTGATRVLLADGTLVATPVATRTILAGNHQGLLGLALAPDFATSNELFVYAAVPASMPHADRNQVVRYTLTGNVATSTAVVVDDLPLGTLQNGGEILFGPDGHLYVSLGDTNVQALAQTPGVLPGRVLRYTRAGGVPADNPVAANPEWCRGLRNTFGMAFHPTTGGLFGADNGPNTDDELNYLVAGKDFGWPSPVAGGTAGLRLRLWAEVIAPTSLAWQHGGAFGAAYDDDLFLASYVNEEVLRLEMSGAAFVDVDRESVFAKWAVNSIVNKPLHLLRAADGSLLVSTFDSIYRIRKAP